MDDSFFEEELFAEIDEILKKLPSEKESSPLEEYKTDKFYKIIEMIINGLQKIALGSDREIKNFSIDKNLLNLEKFLSILREIENLEEKLKKVISNKEKIQINREETNKKKLPKGLVTPREKYYLPILESLYELGGKGTVKEVLDKVQEKMKDILSEYDYGILQSGSIRWSKNAQWARLDLVHKGLLKRNSPLGIWELSEEGYKFLMEHRNK
ncbi:MAG: winged helix-turn-helix domain-containing protein [Dictyoglomus sp.]